MIAVEIKQLIEGKEHAIRQWGERLDWLLNMRDEATSKTHADSLLRQFYNGQSIIQELRIEISALESALSVRRNQLTGEVTP